MSNGTKIVLGLIVFALGMLIMVSAFCPPSCTVRLITRQHRKTKATGELRNVCGSQFCLIKQAIRHMQQSHSIIQRLLPSAEGNVETNRKHGKHCPLRKASRVRF